VPKLANIEIGEILLVSKLSDIWCRNSRTKSSGGVAVADEPRVGRGERPGSATVAVGEVPGLPETCRRTRRHPHRTSGGAATRRGRHPAPGGPVMKGCGGWLARSPVPGRPVRSPAARQAVGQSPQAAGVVVRTCRRSLGCPRHTRVGLRYRSPPGHTFVASVRRFRCRWSSAFDHRLSALLDPSSARPRRSS
jgi:hypothetical protein